MSDTYTPEEWALVVEWRPLVYKLLAEWASRKTKRLVTMRGRIGQPEFEWVTGGALFGVDGRSFMEDFESVALIAAAEASRNFDPSRGLAFETYLRPVLWHDLEDAFTQWIRTSSSLHSNEIDDALELETEPFVPEDAGDGLEPEVRDALQEALGALTTKEAWALRMHADGVPVRVIQERMGHARDTSTHALIKRAKTKAAAVFERAQEEAAGE